MADTKKTEAKTMTWDDFTSQIGKRGTRKSKYADFIRDMKPQTVYDATALFPTAKQETLASALYGQAKTQNRKVRTIVRDGRMFIALA